MPFGQGYKSIYFDSFQIMLLNKAELWFLVTKLLLDSIYHILVLRFNPIHFIVSNGKLFFPINSLLKSHVFWPKICRSFLSYLFSIYYKFPINTISVQVNVSIE